MLITWDWGSKIDLGLYDIIVCPNCKKPKLHSAIRLHKHLIVSVIPFYISNKYYKKCETCEKETLLEKSVAKQRIKELSIAFSTKDKTAVQRAEEFFNSFTEAIADNEVITFDSSTNQFVIDKEKKEKAKSIVWSKYKNTYEFTEAFYDECMDYYTEQSYDDMLSANVLLSEVGKINTPEARLQDLKDLLEKNLISEQEYLAKKQEILESI